MTSRFKKIVLCLQSLAVLCATASCDSSNSKMTASAGSSSAKASGTIQNQELALTVPLIADPTVNSDKTFLRVVIASGQMDTDSPSCTSANGAKLGGASSSANQRQDMTTAGAEAEQSSNGSSATSAAEGSSVIHDATYPYIAGSKLDPIVLSQGAFTVRLEVYSSGRMNYLGSTQFSVSPNIVSQIDVNLVQIAECPLPPGSVVITPIVPGQAEAEDQTSFATSAESRFPGHIDISMVKGPKHHFVDSLQISRLPGNVPPEKCAPGSDAQYIMDFSDTDLKTNTPVFKFQDFVSPGATVSYRICIRSNGKDYTRKLIGIKTKDGSVSCSHHVILAPVENTPSRYNLGGLAGADAICKAAAPNHLPAKNWKAILSGKQVNAVERFKTYGFVCNQDGKIIAAGFRQILGRPLAAPITFKETELDRTRGRMILTASTLGGIKNPHLEIQVGEDWSENWPANELYTVFEQNMGTSAKRNSEAFMFGRGLDKPFGASGFSLLCISQ